MNRSPFRLTALAAVLLALLYYNVAWAVLRCPHQENYQIQKITAYEPGSSHWHANLDCAGPKYHTEFLAGPSSSAELLRLTRDASHGNVLVSLSGLAVSQIDIEDVSAIASCDTPAALPFDLPRYLSLSVFRL